MLIVIMKKAAIKEDSHKDHLPNYLKLPRPSKGQGFTHRLPRTS